MRRQNMTVGTSAAHRAGEVDGPVSRRSCLERRVGDALNKKGSDGMISWGFRHHDDDQSPVPLRWPHRATYLYDATAAGVGATEVGRLAWPITERDPTWWSAVTGYGGWWGRSR